ncbi:MAG: GAF domain-containing protein [Polyangiaceae bacterium]
MEFLSGLPESQRASLLATFAKPSEPAPVSAPPIASVAPVAAPPAPEAAITLPPELPPTVRPPASQQPFRAALRTEDLEFDDTEIIVETFAQAPVAFAPAPVPLVANPPDPIPWSSPPPPPASRLSSADIIDLLFDAMHNLHFFETAVEGASYCLSVVLGAIPSRGGMVSLYDVDSREFVVAYAQGRHTERLLLTRAPESDPLIAHANHKMRPCVHAYGEDSATAPDRFAFFGEMRSVLVAPVLDGGRFLAVIELVDPTDGSSFSEREVNALTYVTDHLTEYLAERGSAVGKVVAPPSGMVEHIG